MHSSDLKRRILDASVIDLLSPFCEITKAIMSGYMECQWYPLVQMETLLTTKEVIDFQMASTTPAIF
jgi:hypothetical protein